MEEIVSLINAIIWSPALIYLCLGAGLFYSLRSRFLQLRLFGEMLRLIFKSKASNDGISSFQALTLSLAGRVGMGNIAGVAAAIGFGGPGAIFWMWVVGFLGAATAYVESTLAQIYKEQDAVTGQYRGGPAFYLERALGQRWYGTAFAISALIALSLFLPGIQANGVVTAITQVMGEGQPLAMFGMEIGAMRLGVIAAMLAIFGVIIFGGIKRIATFTEVVVPFMAIGYIVLALVIMISRIEMIPQVFWLIVHDAFNAQAGLGAAIGWGVKRGVYSSEAGQGTAPHAAAAAEVDHPAQQGLVQAFSVYIDTLLVCSATAFMILTMGTYNIQGTLPEGQYLVQNVAAGTEINSPAFTQLAMEGLYGTFGNVFIAAAVFFFAFTTILANYYIAEVNVVYLTRFVSARANRFGLLLVKIVMMVMIAYGGLNAAGYIWAIGDIGVGLIAWLNIVGILLIFIVAKPAITALADYERQRKQGVSQFQFDPIKLGIKKASYWESRHQASTVKPTAPIDTPHKP